MARKPPAAAAPSSAAAAPSPVLALALPREIGGGLARDSACFSELRRTLPARFWCLRLRLLGLVSCDKRFSEGVLFPVGVGACDCQETRAVSANVDTLPIMSDARRGFWHSLLTSSTKSLCASGELRNLSVAPPMPEPSTSPSHRRGGTAQRHMATVRKGRSQDDMVQALIRSLMPGLFRSHVAGSAPNGPVRVRRCI